MLGLISGQLTALGIHP